MAVHVSNSINKYDNTKQISVHDYIIYNIIISSHAKLG